MGAVPGFFLLLLPATAPEVLAHRFVWSAGFLLVILAAARQLGDLRRLSARTWLQLLAASAFIAINWVVHRAHFLNHGPGHTALLLLAGPVTAIPLLLFAAAAQRLPLVTLGLLFHLNPGLQMAWGVFVGHGPMPVGRWLGFALIWLALLVFSGDALRRARVDRATLQSSYR